MREITSPSLHDDYWFNDVEIFNRLKYGIDRIELEVDSGNLKIKENSVYDSNGIVYTIDSDTTIDSISYTAGHYYFVRTDEDDLTLLDVTSIPDYAYDPVRKGIYSPLNEKYLAQIYYDNGTWLFSYMAPGQINHMQDYKLNGKSFTTGLKDFIRDSSRLNFRQLGVSSMVKSKIAVGNGWIVTGGYSQNASSVNKGRIFRTQTGFSWEEITSPTDGALTGDEMWKLAYYKSIGGTPAFYLVCENLGGTAGTIGIIRSTNNGSTWSLVYSGASLGTAGNIGWFNNRLILYGPYNGSSKQVVIHSTNGTSWTATDTGLSSAYRFQGLAYGAGKYVAYLKNSASPYQQYSYTSTDLSTWSSANLIVNGRAAGSSQYNLLDYYNGTFVAACEGTTSLSYLATSTNGTSWTLRGFYSTDMETAKVYNLDDCFYITTYYGNYTSKDGVIVRPASGMPWSNTDLYYYANKYYTDDKCFITSLENTGVSGTPIQGAYISSSFYTIKYIEAYEAL